MGAPFRTGLIHFLLVWELSFPSHRATQSCISQLPVTTERVEATGQKRRNKQTRRIRCIGRKGMLHGRQVSYLALRYL